MAPGLPRAPAETEPTLLIQLSAGSRLVVSWLANSHGGAYDSQASDLMHSRRRDGSAGTTTQIGRARADVQHGKAEANGGQAADRRNRVVARPKHLLRHGQRRVRLSLDRDAA